MNRECLKEGSMSPEELDALREATARPVRRWLVAREGEDFNAVQFQRRHRVGTVMDLEDLRDLVALQGGPVLEVDLDGYTPVADSPDLAGLAQEARLAVLGLEVEAPDALVQLAVYGPVHVTPKPYYSGVVERLGTEHAIVTMIAWHGKAEMTIIDEGGQIAVRSVRPIRPEASWKPRQGVQEAPGSAQGVPEPNHPGGGQNGPPGPLQA